MNAAREFQPMLLPLQGRVLIEAGAGTGKTYAIESLFLRLLLEKGLSIRKILVLTYTVAATEDLKRRLREKIRAALAAFDQGTSQDVFLAELVAGNARQAEKAKSLLEEALYGFDEAAIYTIHGFCSWILKEYAFESRTGFDFQPAAESGELIREAADHFWRSRLFEASKLFLAFLNDGGETPETMARWLARALQPSVRFLPEEWLEGPAPDWQAVSAEERNFWVSFEKARTIWAREGEDVFGLLRAHPGLNRNIYRLDGLTKWQSEWEDYFRQVFPLQAPRNLERLCRFEVKKGHAAPEHPFFTACRTLQEALASLVQVFRRYRWKMYGEMRRDAAEYLDRRKKDLRVKTYEDLLLDVASALAGPDGALLAEELRSRFPAALVDEFQDTDPVQYHRILRAVYEAEGPSLFLIGDPKQAIYGFRGADIFAYLSAVKQVSAVFTLGTNWRSVPRLVQGVRTLFASRKAGYSFVFREIHPHPVAPRAWSPEELQRAGQSRDDSPFVWWFLPRGSHPTRIRREEATEAIAGLLCREIQGILRPAESGTPHEAVFRASDIAILVRTHRQAEELLPRLRQAGIPAVYRSSGNVLLSGEAAEVLQILEAAADPSDAGKIKAALGTGLCGVDGNSLAELVQDDSKWEEVSSRFREYRRIWVEQGIMSALRRFLAEQEVTGRVLAGEEGERRVTNLFHLAELLHEAEYRQRLGLEGLMQWFRRSRQDEDLPAGDARELRLETDERAIQLLTVHGSKGLEFPIVFCPFLWCVPGPKTPGQEEVCFHDPAQGTDRFIDLGSPQMDANRLRAAQEKLSEEIRLFYVAVTRARYRCYLVWGALPGAESSAPAYLFHSARSPSREAFGLSFDSVTDRQMVEDLQQLAEESQGAIRVVECAPPEGDGAPLPPELPEARLAARHFSGRILRNWRTASFTALTSGPAWDSRLQGIEERGGTEDRPAGAADPGPEPASGGDIRYFPGGPIAGQMLHEALDRFCLPGRPEIPPGDRIRLLLTGYGFDPDWAMAVETLIGQVREVRLDRVEPGFSLSRLAPGDFLSEMEFCFPLKTVSRESLAACFLADPDPACPGSELADRVRHLGFAPVQGMLKGFIDLVFSWKGRYYLVDWKSNRLGTDPESYRSEALSRVIREECYFLQYYLYSVALHRYLKVFLPGYSYGEHFGGVVYVFLRGIRPDGSEGLFWDRPSEKIVDRLNRALEG